MATYAGQINSVHAIISAKGREVTLRRSTVTLTDPVTQAQTATVQTWPFKAVALPPGKSAEFRIGSLQGRRLLEFHFAQKAQQTTPQPGDVVLWGGQEWVIFWSTTYDPAGDGAIYTLAYAEL